jgi:hypothetical protein
MAERRGLFEEFCQHPGRHRQVAGLRPGTRGSHCADFHNHACELAKPEGKATVNSLEQTRSLCDHRSCCWPRETAEHHPHARKHIQRCGRPGHPGTLEFALRRRPAHRATGPRPHGRRVRPSAGCSAINAGGSTTGGARGSAEARGEAPSRLDQRPQLSRPARCRHARESGSGLDSHAAARHGSRLRTHRAAFRVLLHPSPLCVLGIWVV